MTSLSLINRLVAILAIGMFVGVYVNCAPPPNAQTNAINSNITKASLSSSGQVNTDEYLLLTDDDLKQHQYLVKHLEHASSQEVEKFVNNPQFKLLISKTGNKRKEKKLKSLEKIDRHVTVQGKYQNYEGYNANADYHLSLPINMPFGNPQTFLQNVQPLNGIPIEIVDEEDDDNDDDDNDNDDDDDVDGTKMLKLKDSLKNNAVKLFKVGKGLKEKLDKVKAAKEAKKKKKDQRHGWFKFKVTRKSEHSKPQ